MGPWEERARGEYLFVLFILDARDENFCSVWKDRPPWSKPLIACMQHTWQHTLHSGDFFFVECGCSGDR